VAAPGVPPGIVYRRISPLDIAPTLAAMVGAKPPSGAEGDPLLEVMAATSPRRALSPAEDRLRRELDETASARPK
ncbi:MAG: hypothetical protein P8Y93_08300, partial [Acidobacteriota bacterium]